MAEHAPLLSPVNQMALHELVRRRTGIMLQSYQVEKLNEIVQAACVRFGHSSVEGLLAALERGSNVPEMEYLITRITVGESYFFRDEEQLRFLREAWLPGVVAEKSRSGDRFLRIWSAGCSAGQEIYTIAMLLAEMLPEPQTWSLHLLGTDINTDSLGEAIRGRYSAWSLRATAEDLNARHFLDEGNQQFSLDPRIRDRVKFSYLNLLEDNFPTMLTGTTAMDLILCRNVFIYFDPQLVEPVMRKFHASLVPGGYLILGASDLHAAPLPGLELQQWGNTFCFRRTDGMAASELRSWEPASSIIHPPSYTPEPPPALDLTAKPWAEPVPAPSDSTPARKGPLYPDVVLLLREERWDAVVQAVDAHTEAHGFDAELAQHKAKALANLGLLDDAARESERSLDMAPMDKHTYLIRALVMLELNDMEKATEALRKAIYLEPNFVEAHFQLGLLQLRMGDRRSGMRSLSNALDLAEKLDPNRQVHNAPGMVFGRLAEILRKEINVYTGD